MRELLALLLALGLGITGYAPQPTPEPPAAVTPAPEAAPSERAAKPWEADPKGYVLERLDALLDEGQWNVQFWIFPGSGPCGDRMPESEYGEALRALFASYDWQLTQAPTYDEDEAAAAAPDSYSISIYPSYTGSDREIQPIYCGNYSPVLQMGTWSEEEGYGSLFFTAPGAENLCAALSDLWPGWEELTGCRTRTAPQSTHWATAKTYLEGTFTALRDKGHILGARIDSLEYIPPEWDGESVGNNYMTYDDSVAVHFRAKFSLKPTRPELTYWQERGVDRDGWVHYEFDKIVIGLCGDGLYELSWFEIPMEE